ncbi:hypothetical protein [Halorarum salinum]|uniref:Uncharacterized protein n=1 Tax=Halorarum salinum TaxID=2743089 RepID=A0A7D5QAU9_9EURY|nr:hypothetical protein [Halobaculum salinum]QLG62058.1 hypothetical protein HUG12_10095 [Halobaculum salinum]
MSDSTGISDVISWLETTAEGANKPVEQAIHEAQSAEDLAFRLEKIAGEA